MNLVRLAAHLIELPAQQRMQVASLFFPFLLLRLLIFDRVFFRSAYSWAAFARATALARLSMTSNNKISDPIVHSRRQERKSGYLKDMAATPHAAAPGRFAIEPVLPASVTSVARAVRR